MIPLRPKHGTSYDGTAVGNRVGSDREGYRPRALRTIEAFHPQWSRTPQALPQMLCAIELALAPPRHVVLAGDPATDDFQALAAVLHEKLGPRRSLLCADGGPGQAWLAARLPWLAGMHPLDGRSTAFVCEHLTCQAPVTEPAALRVLLAGPVPLTDPRRP